MMKKRAFTLTETLIMVAVIGIIAVISVVSLKGSKPDKDAMMVRKAYNDISKAVQTLINDQDLYPLATAKLDLYNLITLQQYSVAAVTYDDTLQPIVGVCYRLAQTGYDDEPRCATDTIDGYICKSDCSYSCDVANGYQARIDDYGNTLCELPDDPSPSSGASSDVLSSVIRDPINVDDNNAAADITKDDASTGTSNLKDGSYSDTPYEKTGTASAALKPRGMIFTNVNPPADCGASCEYDQSNKFAYNFGKLFKTNNNKVDCEDNTCTFTTVDGMEWKVQDNFSSTQNAIVTVDINGPQAGLNTSNNVNADIFKFKVDAGGGISVYTSGNSDKKAADRATAILKNRKYK